MKWPLFEKKINMELSSHLSEVNVEAIWSAVESDVDALNKKKKKRRGLFWLFFAGVLFVGSSLAYFYLNKNHLNHANLNDTQVLSTASGFVNNTEQNSQQVGIVEDDNKEKNEEELMIVEATKPSISIKKENKKNSTNAKKKSIASSNVNGAFPKNTALSNAPIPKPKVTKEKKKPVKEQVAPVLSTSTNPSLEKPENSIPATVITEKESVSVETKSPIISEASPILEEGETTVLIETDEANTVEGIIETPEEKVAEENPQKEEKEDRKKAFSLSAAVQASISFTDREINAKDPTFDDLVRLREINERILETWQAGIRLNLHHQSGLELTSGVNYTQINERFTYNATVTTTDSIFGIQMLIVDLFDQVDTIYGNVPLDRTTTFNKKYYNKYKMIEVPILVGYRASFYEYTVGVQAGVFTNIRMDTEGHILQNESEDIDVESENIYKSKVGLSYYFGVSAGYSFNDKLEIYVAPFVRFFPKNFAADAYGLQQKYKLYGINAGARFMF